MFSAPRWTQRRKRLAAVAAAALTAPLLWAVGTTASTAEAAAPTADWLHTRGNQIVDEAGKANYYRMLLNGVENLDVVSISPARHFVMFDQPEKFAAALDAALKSMRESPKK